MQVANMLSGNGKGVVIFLEDIDKILHERTNDTNEISLLMDGGETKNKNIITVLTTNHIENISPTFLRGKRIGSVVSLTYPDKATAKKMIEAYLVDEHGNSLLSEECDDAAMEVEKNQIVPAFIAEILDRVKAHLIYTGNSTVNCQDIISSIKSYKKQMEIATVKTNSETDADALFNALKKTVGGGKDAAAALKEVLEEKGF